MLFSYPCGKDKASNHNIFIIVMKINLIAQFSKNINTLCLETALTTSSECNQPEEIKFMVIFIFHRIAHLEDTELELIGP